MDPSNQGKKEHSTCRKHSRVNASGLPGTVSRGNDPSAAGGQVFWAGNDGLQFAKARASALFSCLDADRCVVSSSSA